MKAKEFFKKFTEPVIWGNLLAMAIVIAAVIAGTWKGLEHYTHHGEIIEVPDVREKGISDARYTLYRARLEAVLADSSYRKNLPPGTVLEQTPAPGAKVKSGHAIYLIVNSGTSPTLPIPDIADNSSLREAEARLRAMGFKIGPKEEIDGEKDWVYGVKYKGKLVYAGDRLPVDAVITLQVGKGYSHDVWSDSTSLEELPSEQTESYIEDSNDLSDFEF